MAMKSTFVSSHQVSLNPKQQNTHIDQQNLHFNSI